MNVPPPQLALDVATEIGDEKLLWAASPTAWEFARRKWKRALIGIPVAAFAILWTWGASGGFTNGRAAPPFFMLSGWVFICIGISMFVAPLFAAWKAGRVYYVVTDKRAVIVERVWRLNVRSFDAKGIEDYECISRGDTGGDIILQKNIVRRGKDTRVSEVGFFGIADLSEAERALRSVIALYKKRANKAPEPTPGAVTPRATERVSK